MKRYFKQCDGLLRQRVELRYQFIESETATYPVAVLCRIMQVSQSDFYAWRRRDPDEQRQVLPHEVREFHRQKRGSYGSRRMAKELRRRGYDVGRYQARSLMREAGVEARQRRRWRHATDSEHSLPVALNLLNRQFMEEAPNRAWVADITASWTPEEWLYLEAVLDLHSRQLVGWQWPTTCARNWCWTPWRWP